MKVSSKDSLNFLGPGVMSFTQVYPRMGSKLILQQVKEL